MYTMSGLLRARRGAPRGMLPQPESGSQPTRECHVTEQGVAEQVALWLPRRERPHLEDRCKAHC